MMISVLYWNEKNEENLIKIKNVKQLILTDEPKYDIRVMCETCQKLKALGNEVVEDAD